MQDQIFSIYTLAILIIIFTIFIIPGIVTILAAGNLSRSVQSSSIVMITAGLLVLVTLPLDFFMNIFLAKTMTVSDFAKFSLYKTYVFKVLNYLALLSVSLGFLFLSSEIKKKLKIQQNKEI